MGNKLKLGVAREIITPKIGTMLYGYPSKPVADGVHDDLLVTAYAFSYNDIKVILVSATVCNFRNDIANALREGLAKKHGVPFENIILTATHTHSGPALSGMFGLWGGFNQEYHDEIFRPALFSAVEKAIIDMEAVTMATASGNSDIGVNRRVLTVENTIDFGQCKWGPYNPEMVILSFKGEDGKIKGNLICYGAHGTAAGATTKITRDWSGYMTDALEEKTGGLTSFLLGPEGDVAPRVENEIRGVDRIGEMEKLGKKAAADALAIFDKIKDEDYAGTDIAIRSDVLHLPVKPRPSLEEARKAYDNIPENPVKTIHFLQQDYYTNVMKSYEEGYEDVECEEVPQIIFRIGNIVFATFGYEIFSEIGMRIDEAVEEYKVISVVVANGQGGYFPTQSQLCLGGYEVNMFKTQSVQPYVDDADFHMMKETVRNVNELK